MSRASSVVIRLAIAGALACALSGMLWAQDQSQSLGDVAKKTRMQNANAKAKVTLNDDDKPIVVGQAPAETVPGAAPSAVVDDDSDAPTTYQPVRGASDLDAAKGKVAFYEARVANDNKQIADAQAQREAAKDIPGRERAYEDLIGAKQQVLAGDQQQLDEAKNELGQLLPPDQNSTATPAQQQQQTASAPAQQQQPQTRSTLDRPPQD